MELQQMLALTDAQVDALEESALVHVHLQLGEYVRSNRQYAALNKQMFVFPPSCLFLSAFRLDSIEEDCRSMVAERALARRLASFGSFLSSFFTRFLLAAIDDLRAVRADGPAVGEFLGGIDAAAVELDTSECSRFFPLPSVFQPPSPQICSS